MKTLGKLVVHIIVTYIAIGVLYPIFRALDSNPDLGVTLAKLATVYICVLAMAGIQKPLLRIWTTEKDNPN